MLEQFYEEFISKQVNLVFYTKIESINEIHSISINILMPDVFPLCGKSLWFGNMIVLLNVLWIKENAVG